MQYKAASTQASVIEFESSKNLEAESEFFVFSFVNSSSSSGIFAEFMLSSSSVRQI